MANRTTPLSREELLKQQAVELTGDLGLKQGRVEEVRAVLKWLGLRCVQDVSRGQLVEFVRALQDEEAVLARDGLWC